jgi:riboflavin synthase
MFTGLIEAVGEVADVSTIPDGLRLEIRAETARDLQPGDSVAVNGVCLTAVAADPTAGAFRVEIGPETARVSSLGDLRPGSLVNLERALRQGDRLGGHFVLGHVDGTGSIVGIRHEGDFCWFAVSYPISLAPLLIHRGSVAVDGISLTVARLDGGSFDIQVVPFTLAHTNLRTARPGQRVNLECDVLGKYVIRALEVYGAAAPQNEDA